MIDWSLYPGDRVICSNHDLARAVFVHQVPQRFGGEDQGIEIELLQILAWLFLQGWSFALVRKNGTAVVHSGGVGRQEAAAVCRADFHVREAVKDWNGCGQLSAPLARAFGLV